MPAIRIPIYNLVQPPPSFNTLEEAHTYVVDLHRDIENLISVIDSVINANYTGT